MPHELVQAIGEGVQNHFSKPDYQKLFKIGFFIVFVTGPFLWLVSNNLLLPMTGKCHDAVILNTTFHHRSNPSTLVYVFFINGKRYTGDSGENTGFKFRIGSPICIVYLPYYPGTNKPVNYFFRGEIKCNRSH